MEMMSKTEVVAKNYAKEKIPSCIETVQNLMEELYVSGFVTGVNKLKNEQDWIRINKCHPENGDFVQILVYDNSGDTPFAYVATGVYVFKDTWVVDNDLLTDKVIGWKRLSSTPPMEYCTQLFKEIHG